MCSSNVSAFQSHNGLSRKVNEWGSLVSDPSDILPEAEELLKVETCYLPLTEMDDI